MDFARRLALGAIIVTLHAVSAKAEPARPVDDSLVLAASAPRRAGSEGEMARLAADPGNLDLALGAARLAIEDGRANADPRSYGQAQAALAPWWEKQDAPKNVRVLRAVIRQANHEFAAAGADLDAILAEDPRDAQARLSRAFLKLVTGDIAGAAEDCRQLPPPAGRLVRAICLARTAALSGQGEAARALLARMLAGRADLSDPMAAFGTGVLAEINIGLGRKDDARTLLAAVVGRQDPDVYALAAYADFLLDAGKPGEVLTLLAEKGVSDAVLLRLTIAAKHMGDPRLQSWSGILDERFAAAKAAGIRLHLREEARLRLEVQSDVRSALPLAVENWNIQKEPADAVLLLQCALAAQEPMAAQPVVDFLKATGLKDVRLDPLLARLGEMP